MKHMGLCANLPQILMFGQSFIVKLWLNKNIIFHKTACHVEVELLSKTEAHHHNKDQDLQNDDHTTKVNDPPLVPVRNGYNLVRDG